MTARPDIRREDLISRAAAIKHLDIPSYSFDRWAKRAGLTRYRVIGDNRVFYHRDDLNDLYNPIEIVESAS